MRPSPRRSALALAAFAASSAWSQTVERLAPVAVPAPVAYVGAVAPVQLPVGALSSLALPSVAVPVAPAAAAAALAAPRLAAPAQALPLAQARSIAAPAVTAWTLSRAGLAEPIKAGERDAPAVEAYGPLEASPTFAKLSELAGRSEATGGDSARRLSWSYDRSRGREARAPVAAPAKAAPGFSGDGSGNRPKPGYEGKQGRELLEAVSKDLARSHRSRGYDEARAQMFGRVDQVERNGRRGIQEAYSQIFVPGTSDRGGDYREPGDSNGDGWVDRDGMNAEHIWPQSFFAKKLPMRSDLHNLMPTFIHPNSLRGHLPFGEVKGTPEYSNSAGAKLGGGVFEPPNAIKGRVARSILYFVARYQHEAVRQGPYSEQFLNSRLEMFLRWNRQFPPDAEELTRNGRVAEFQGNRNVFVDDPALADRIGVDGFRMLASKSLRSRPQNQGTPHFNPQALIETARMKPHGRRGGPRPGEFWQNGTGEREGGFYRNGTGGSRNGSRNGSGWSDPTAAQKKNKRRR